MTKNDNSPALTERFDVLVVGAGHAGAQTAVALRQRGFRGSVAMLGEETELPYERPPLSKEYLAGEKDFEGLLIRPARFWAERGIGLLQGRRVTAVEPRAHHVVTDTGETFGYGILVWAAGGHARRLSCAGHDFAGVHTVRSRADVERMLTELATTRRVVVVGGGYIGLEAAAVLTKLGKQVTVVEAQDRVLARVAGEPLSRFYEAQHRGHGVDIRLNAAVAGIEGARGGASGVRLGDGEVIPGEMVIVGIGIVPSVAPLRDAGANGDNGVRVDEFCRTSLPDIFAIGDCALHANRFAGGMPIRLESVQNANDMAMTVAKGLTGDLTPYDAVPWFWSNQYDLKLQTVGLSIGYDQTIVRGDPRSQSFSVIYLQQGRVLALDCVNAAKDFVQGRALVAGRVEASPPLLVDVRTPLKSLL